MRTGIPPWLLAIAAMLCFQLSAALAVPIINLIGPAGTAWLQLCMGSVLLWIIVRPPVRSLRLKDVPALLGLGAATGLVNVFFLSAIERIPLGTAIAIQLLGPLVLAGVTAKRKSALLWPVLAFGGVVLLTEPWSGRIDMIGVGFVLLGAVGWACYILLTQRVGDRFSGVSGLSITIPVAAIVTTFFGLPQVLGSEFPWWVFPAIAGLALLAPVITYGLEMLALRRMTKAAFGTLFALEPVFGLLMGLIVLSQLPTLLQIIGIVIVVFAGAMAQRGGLRAPLEFTEVNDKTRRTRHTKRR